MIDENDRHYISLLQDNINRMASNSSNCKTWLITLVAAITALQLTTEDLRNILWIAVVLVVLFYLVDSYYLSLERKFIELEKEFVALCKTKEENKDALTDRLYCFDINSVKNKRATLWSSLGSGSTFPFYLVLFLLTLLICIWPHISNICYCNG